MVGQVKDKSSAPKNAGRKEGPKPKDKRSGRGKANAAAKGKTWDKKEKTKDAKEVKEKTMFPVKTGKKEEEIKYSMGGNRKAVKTQSPAKTWEKKEEKAKTKPTEKKHENKTDSPVKSGEMSGEIQRDRKPGRNNRSPLSSQAKIGESVEEIQKSTEVICGKNSVLEALKSSREINRVLLAEGLEPAFARQVIDLCRGRAVPYRTVGRNHLAKIAGEDNRGVVAEVASASYVEVSDMLAAAQAAGQSPLIVILDGVEDPHNLGAVIRTALCAGAHGLVIPKRNAVSLNQTVSRVSAGAIEHLPVARVANLVQTVDELKKEGLWIVAADMNGERLWDVDMSGPLAIVLGGEGRGIAPLLRSRCDFVASIPLKGAVSSLNVSAAAAVMLYEALRRRQK